MKTKLQFYKELKDFITPENWCKNYYAKNSRGENCNYASAEACQWCFEGAYYKVMRQNPVGTRKLLDGAYGDVLETCEALYSEWSMVAVNDRFGLEAVHKVLDRLIQREEKENVVSD